MVYPGSICWNAIGEIDSDDWLTKDGLYPKTIMAMICRLTAADEAASVACPTGPFRKMEATLSVLSFASSLILSLYMIV